MGCDWREEGSLLHLRVSYSLSYLMIPHSNIHSLFSVPPFSDAKNMAVDVRNILTKILSTKGNMSEADAVQYLKKMEAQKRYSADVWS